MSAPPIKKDTKVPDPSVPRTVIGRHIRNIYKEEELEKSITCAKFAHMGTDGDQEYEYTAYNLDVIISVGYTKRGTKFRQWANGILKEYLLRGYVVNARIMALEQHVADNISQRRRHAATQRHLCF